MADRSDIERVVGELSPIQREGFLALSGRWRLGLPKKLRLLSLHLIAPHFVEMRRSEDWQRRHQYRLTPLGQAVRAHIQEQPHHD